MGLMFAELFEEEKLEIQNELIDLLDTYDLDYLVKELSRKILNPDDIKNPIINRHFQILGNVFTKSEIKEHVKNFLMSLVSEAGAARRIEKIVFEGSAAGVLGLLAAFAAGLAFSCGLLGCDPIRKYCEWNPKDPWCTDQYGSE